MEELDSAVELFSANKASGPDGINMGYFKHFLQYYKDRVLESFLDFTDAKPLPSGMNSSFIALIPKVKVSMRVQDYRLISLINCVTKLLTKVMARRLKPLVDKLFDKHQFGFVKKRQAAKSILLSLKTWELVELTRLDGVISCITLTSKKDELIWLQANGVFTVKNVISACNKNYYVEGTNLEFIWKVKSPEKVRMTMFLEATDPEYLDRIKEGPHNPTKLAVAVAGEAAKSVPKEKSDYTAEDIASIAKDAKVQHLLHSAIDNVMSNRVINCKTTKEIWDALETRCQGTDSIKKNRKTILTQEYEHFDSKPNESLTDLYDRFVKLLNDLSLVDKEYDLEDSNLKFLVALPESWDLKATTIRDNYNLDETILDEIYGMLKTHELEMEQRSKRKGGKSRTVALKAEEESPGSKGGKSDIGDYTNAKCYNCGEKGHISPDCKKVKSDKGKVLVTKKKNWTDISDSESEENYALMTNTDMANAESSTEAAELKVPQTTYAFHTDDINELRRYLKTIFISYRDQTLTYERLTSENLACKKRNDYLEKELVMFHQTQKDRDDAFYVRDEVLKMNESLKAELEKEREIIRTWTNSGRTTQNLLSSENWKEGLGYGDDKNDEGTVDIKSIVVKQKPKLKPVKFVAIKSDTEKSKVKKELTSDKLKQEKTTEVNVGLMTKKQLKHKLKDVKNANKVKSPRKNRNGKEGVNKSNDYKPIPDTPRKTCHNCGSSNHLASFCRKNKNINSLPSKSGVKSQYVRYKPQNPCFHCGSLWHSIYTCKEYHSLYYDYYQIKPSLKKVSIVPSSVSSDSKSDSVNSDKKNININSDAKCVANVNKLNKAKGSKQVWVLKTNH
ncbi:hypothetical protein AgCh_012893 [Apium graveolens]